MADNKKFLRGIFNTRKRLHGHFQIYSIATRVSIWQRPQDRDQERVTIIVHNLQSGRKLF